MQAQIFARSKVACC